VFGIGLSRAYSILDAFGFSFDYSMNDVNIYIYNILVSYIKPYFILDIRLKELNLQRLEFFFENNFIKGIRIFNGLPIRGQRTHTNSSTPKRLKPFSEKFNEIIVERNKRLIEFAKRKEKKKK
jgi:small subunit ribosomal protein S13